MTLLEVLIALGATYPDSPQDIETRTQRKIKGQEERQRRAIAKDVEHQINIVRTSTTHYTEITLDQVQQCIDALQMVKDLIATIDKYNTKG